ncbi:hypothetical protein ACTA71_005800 [Dictyostelium dimigraforme]
MKVLLLLVCLIFTLANASYDACYNVVCPSNYQCRGEGDQAYCVPEHHDYGCDRFSCGRGFECVERWNSYCCKPIHHRPPHPHPRPPHPHPRPTNCDYTSCPREFSCHVINRNITACLPDSNVCRDFQCPAGTHCFNGETGPHCVSDMHYPNLCHVTECSYDYTCKMVRGNPTCLRNQINPTHTPTTTPTTSPSHCTTCAELATVCHSAGLVCRTILNPACGAAIRGIINTRACCTYLALCVSNSTSTTGVTTTTTTSTTGDATTDATTTSAASTGGTPTTTTATSTTGTPTTTTTTSTTGTTAAATTASTTGTTATTTTTTTAS